MHENKEIDVFCGHPVKNIGAGRFDEIYCYHYVDDLLIFMDDLFKLTYRPNWIRIEKNTYTGKEAYEIRLCFLVNSCLTLNLSFEERILFVKKFNENFENSPFSNCKFEFQLFYMDNGAPEVPDDVVIVTNANLSTVSSVKNQPIDFYFSRDSKDYNCQLYKSNFKSVVRSIEQNNVEQIKKIGMEPCDC